LIALSLHGYVTTFNVLGDTITIDDDSDDEDDDDSDDDDDDRQLLILS